MKETYVIEIKQEITKDIFIDAESEQEALAKAHKIHADEKMNLEHEPENEAERKTFFSVDN